MTNVIKLGRHVPTRTLQKLVEINDQLYQTAEGLRPSAERDDLLARAESMRVRLNGRLEQSARLEKASG